MKRLLRRAREQAGRRAGVQLFERAREPVARGGLEAGRAQAESLQVVDREAGRAAGQDARQLRPEGDGPERRVGVLAIVLAVAGRSEEHTSELQSLAYLVCRLLL